jgi:myo-inositol-1(or 4)-monophosphatase
MLFFGEEDAPAGSKLSRVDAKLANDDEWLWIVDPIDGTTNFVHGMPLCMPSAVFKQPLLRSVLLRLSP